MILSWRGDQSQQTKLVFDGSSDVNMFLFYFENVVMCDKDYAKKSLALIPHLDGEAFQLFFDKFTKNGKLNNAVSDLEKLNVFMDGLATK